MLKKLIFIFVLVFSSATLFSQANQNTFLGSKTLYKPLQEKYTAAPKGYVPVFINHVGRHGARHLTKDVNTSLAYGLLLRADSLNDLTDKGKLLKKKIWNLEKVEKKSFESISYEGEKEQVGIAARMYAHFMPVFKSTPSVLNVAVTKKIRTTQTAEAFLSALETKVKNPKITMAVNDTTLRFYDLAPAYLNFEDHGSWHTKLEELKLQYNYEQLVRNFTTQFFKPSFFKNLSVKVCEKFTSDIFGFTTIFFSLEKEIVDNGFDPKDVEMSSLFTCNQLNVLGTIDDAEDYLVKGPGTNVSGIQVKIAVPLLADFINTTDDFINKKSVNAQIRFTHAEGIAPFAAIMGIEGASEALNDLASFESVWSAGKIIPLSANIQWILYKQKDTKSYMVKFLLNEKEVAIKGLSNKTFPYYKWEDVKTLFTNKIKGFNSTLNENGFKYLKELKE